MRGCVYIANCMAWYYRHWSPLLQEDFCQSTSCHSHPDGGVSHVGRDFTPMAPAPPSSVESWPCLPCRTPWGAAYPQPAMPAGGRCLKDSVLPRSYWQEWWNWESTKKEFQNMATMARVMWFVDENEAVNRILEIVCRDEIAMAITYKVAKEPDALKEGRATKRRRKDVLYDKTKAQAWNTLGWWEQCIREYSGTTCRRRGTESRVYSPGAICFTVCAIVGLPVFWLFFAFVCVVVSGGFLVVLFCWVTGIPLSLHLGCTRSSFIPRVSPSSWWAQHWSKKNFDFGPFRLDLHPNVAGLKPSAFSAHK